MALLNAYNITNFRRNEHVVRAETPFFIAFRVQPSSPDNQA